MCKECKDKEGTLAVKASSVPFQCREAWAFPLRTLVLAYQARSRHDRPVCLRAEGGRNLRGHYRRASKLKSNYDESRKMGWILAIPPIVSQVLTLEGEPDSELDDPGFSRTRDLAKGCVADVGIRVIELRVIEQV